MEYSKITSKRQLANFLRCEESFLDKLINRDYYLFDTNGGNTPRKGDEIVIRKLYLKKKGKIGGYREVYEAHDFHLANTLKILNNSLSKSFTPEDNVHGFVHHRSIKSNASQHLAKKLILSVDIKDFFDSINRDQIKYALIKHSFTEQVADWISTITTFNNHLIQGFHCSPTLANMVFTDIDVQLNKLAGNDVKYTRYADDLYFSTNKELPNLKDIEKIINSGGFELNHKKTSIMKRGRKQYVTGLTVFDHYIPRITKRVKRNLRLEIHYINKYGYRNHAIKRLTKSDANFNKKDEGKILLEISEVRHRINGWLDFMNSIEPNTSNKLRSKLIESKE